VLLLILLLNKLPTFTYQIRILLDNITENKLLTY